MPYCQSDIVMVRENGLDESGVDEVTYGECARRRRAEGPCSEIRFIGCNKNTACSVTFNILRRSI